MNPQMLQKIGRVMIIVGIIMVLLGMFLEVANAKDFYSWTPSLSLSVENKDRAIFWGSFEMQDRVFYGNFFYDKEFNAFVIWNDENYHINPGVGFRLGVGYRIGDFQPHVAGGIATVYNANEISDSLTNSFIHCTMRAGIDYIPWNMGIMVDHLSEPFEDDGGITTFGFVIRF
jgi:hypothetical protein